MLQPGAIACTGAHADPIASGVQEVRGVDTRAQQIPCHIPAMSCVLSRAAMLRVSVLKLLCNILLSAVIFLLPRAIASPTSDDMMEVSSPQSTTDVTLKLE